MRIVPYFGLNPADLVFVVFDADGKLVDVYRADDIPADYRAAHNAAFTDDRSSNDTGAEPDQS